MPLQKSPRPVKPAGKAIRKIPTVRPAAPVNISRVPLRPVSKAPVAGANIRRAEQRDIRREAARQVAKQVQTARPRPVVRPAAPPRKVMAKASQPQPRPGYTQPARPAAQAAGIGMGTAAAAAVGLFGLNAANAHADISAEVSVLQSSLANLQNQSSFGAVRSELTNLENMLTRVTDLLESARDKGYRYQAELEEIAYGAFSKWQAAYPQVETTLQRQSSAMQAQVIALNPQIQRLNANLYSSAAAAPHLRSLQTQINALLAEAARVESSLTSGFGDINTQVYQLNSRLTDIHWALDQLNEARFKPESGEDLVMAVPARWDQEGKDDPEGVLYLTNKRVIFERKEKVATKKVLFITTASELVQEVLIDQPLANMANSKAENKGIFGHQDYLQVQFNDRKLGTVSFHLNGQDSKDWTALIERVCSGQIETERATGSSGLSMSDLTRPITNADMLGLQAEVNALQDEMMLKGSRQELANLENDVRSLERKLAEVRARGYVIEKDLEADIAVLSAQWERVKTNAEATISYQTEVLSEQMRSIQTSLAQLVGMSANLNTARPLYMQVKSAIASAEAQADAAEATVLTQYDEYADEIESLHAHMEWIDWMLAALSTASFRLLATESGVAAVEALYLPAGLDAENGVLFLTDQRLLWEDRVGTYELKVNVPLREVLEVRKELDESGEQELLVFSLGASGTGPEARFQLAQLVADEWLTMVGRARSGGYDLDRAVSISEEELERIRNAPQQCSNCGAAYTAPILRGQTEIICEYCGVVTRF
ncbi:MAG TPA: hypothetical protein VLA49_15600 [Anaerolineales bacterium]|nr:hypothetical protein [Anaerolineales bacterium]